MTLYLFRLLAPKVQLLYVLERGTYLAHRWEDDGGVNLYHLLDKGRGFFVEVGIDDGRGQAVVLRSFSSSLPLEDYAHGLRLPSE
jgi:DNA-binding PadR family transcriptional regulator